MDNMEKSYQYYKLRLGLNNSSEAWTTFIKLSKKNGIYIHPMLTYT